MSHGPAPLEHQAARALVQVFHNLEDERLERVKLRPDLTSGNVCVSALAGLERALGVLNHAHHIQNDLA